MTLPVRSHTQQTNAYSIEDITENDIANTNSAKYLE